MGTIVSKCMDLLRLCNWHLPKIILPAGTLAMLLTASSCLAVLSLGLSLACDSVSFIFSACNVHRSRSAEGMLGCEVSSFTGDWVFCLNCKMRKSKQFSYIPYGMKVYMEFNLVTLPRIVKFTE